MSSKLFFYTVSLLSISLTFNACNNTNEESKTAKEEATPSKATIEAQAAIENFDADYNEINSAIDAYMLLKDALVAAQADHAKQVAEKLAMHSEGEIKSAAEAISTNNDLKKQRASFNLISQKMYESLKTEGTEHVIYKQYCPMAFNNEGAYWLSKEEKIMNPYFGDMMLKCGRVDETIEVVAN